MPENVIYTYQRNLVIKKEKIVDSEVRYIIRIRYDIIIVHYLYQIILHAITDV